MAERRLPGLPASPGLAFGPLVRLADQSGPDGNAESGPAPLEAARLRAALDQALDELKQLMAAEAELGAEILAFQVELLADPALAEPAFAAIETGAGAAAAWDVALGEQVAIYDAGEDDWFKARASDLRDLGARVDAALAGRAADGRSLPDGAIVLAEDLPPSRFLELDWQRLGGAALADGSPMAHVAILARARGVPLITGLGGLPAPTADAILDAEAGILVLEPAAATKAAYAERRRLAAGLAERAAAVRGSPARTADGQGVEVMVNIDHPDAADDGALADADGVGLFRTEFLFIGQAALPDEAAQLAAYVGMLDRLAGRPCIIRTLDVGGDKPLPGISLPTESNPFLGLRGLRLCLARPELFRPQVRALLRAAVGRPLKVMLPMVTIAAELEAAREVFAACFGELAAAGIPAALPSLGIMVEVPAAAIAIDLLDAEFYSIGSNDLTQYVMAASREAGGPVAALGDPLHPAVLRLIEAVLRHGQRTGRPVSLCGDMAADPRALRRLLQLGLRRISVPAAALGRVKLTIAEFRADG